MKISGGVVAVREEMRAAGAWVFSGGLHAPSTATVLDPRSDRDGDELPAERGSGCGGSLAEVLGGTDEPPLAKPLAVVDGTSVAEADEVERPD